MLFTSRADGNLSPVFGDATDARSALARRLGVGRVVWAGQAHGPAVAFVDGRTDLVPGVDALVTRTPGVGVAVLVADCLPILLSGDRVVAALHAGRRGLVAGVVANAVAETGPDVRAVIGPGIGPCCYEVGHDVYDEVVAVLPATATPDGRALDLPSGAVEALRAAGVTEIERAGLCTACDPAYFSHRRAPGEGRQAGAIALP